MQTLTQISFSGSLTLTGSVHRGPPERHQKLRLLCPFFIRQCDSFHRLRLSRKGVRSARHIVDRIEQHFSRQALGVIPCVVLNIVRIAFIWIGTQLISATVTNGPNQLLKIETTFTKGRRELLEQFGNGRVGLTVRRLHAGPALILLVDRKHYAGRVLDDRVE